MKSVKTLLASLAFCFLSSAIFSQSLPVYVPANGLLGWWGFSGNADDYSGHGNHGLVNGATLTLDRHSNPDQAFSFNGTTDYIEVADTPALRLDNTSFTISFWVKIDAYTSPATAFIVKRTNGNYNGWLLAANSFYTNRIELKTSQGTDPNLYSDSTLSESSWHHVALVYHLASAVDFYFDGVLSSTHPGGGLSFSANCTSVMRFGHDTQTPPGNYFLNGAMDDIGIWNLALSPQDISNLFLETTSSVNQLDKSYFGIYTNPVNDVIHLSANDVPRDVLVRIADITGRYLFTGWMSEANTIDVSMLRNGLYFLQVGEQSQYTRKFVKQ